MKLMMLGASVAQLQGIVKAQNLGCQVVTCDYLKDAIGHQYSDEQCFTSTFDVEGVCEAAKMYKVDGLMTMGTDQPVYTAAVVAEKLALPTQLTSKIALGVTHKKVMKHQFDVLGLPTVAYVIFAKGDSIAQLEALAFPVVIKPVDSQGQRGLFYCRTPEEVVSHVDDVLVFSRENYLLVETYYPHEEVTLSGWVVEGNVHILSITDRITFNEKERLGICLAHSFPTKHKETYGRELIDLTYKIVQGFDIMNGPIYFQFLIGKEGVKINEIACRIGGAYESVYLPDITGFDLCEAVVKEAMNLRVDVTSLDHYDFMTTTEHRSVQLFFAEACQVVSRPEIEEILSIEGVIDCHIHYKVGEMIGTIENATARAGYVIVQGTSKEALLNCLDQVYEQLVIIGKDHKNHIIHETYNSLTNI